MKTKTLKNFLLSSIDKELEEKDKLDIAGYILSGLAIDYNSNYIDDLADKVKELINEKLTYNYKK